MSSPEGEFLLRLSLKRDKRICENNRCPRPQDASPESKRGGTPATEVACPEIQKMKRVKARIRFVKTYEKARSIRRTAKLRGTSLNVVRKWIRRYEEKGKEGLEDHKKIVFSLFVQTTILRTK